MKLARIIFTSAIVVSLGLAGCGANNKTDQQTSQDPTKQGTSTQTPSSIKMGVTKLLSITADLKTAIDAGNESKVKEIGPQLRNIQISIKR
jgi:uncharacterized lipoprotein